MLSEEQVKATVIKLLEEAGTNVPSRITIETYVRAGADAQFQALASTPDEELEKLIRPFTTTCAYRYVKECPSQDNLACKQCNENVTHILTLVKRILAAKATGHEKHPEAGVK